MYNFIISKDLSVFSCNSTTLLSEYQQFSPNIIIHINVQLSDFTLRLLPPLPELYNLFIIISSSMFPIHCCQYLHLQEYTFLSHITSNPRFVIWWMWILGYCCTVPLGAEHGALHRLWNGSPRLQRRWRRGASRWNLRRVAQEESHDLWELWARGSCCPQRSGSCWTLLLLH